MSRLSSLLVLCVFLVPLSAATLVNPLAPFPGPRVAVGFGYHLDGISIGDRAVPAIINRIAARTSFSPVEFVNIGLEGGAAQMEVASDSSIYPALPVFHGNYKFSYAGSLKLSTPLLKETAGLFGVVKGGHFGSEDSKKAGYSCYDATGVVGLLFHIPRFGYAAIGPRLYYIKGEAENSDGTKHNFNNVNNMQGWAAVEWFPKTSSGSIPYITAEISFGPKVSFGDRTPVNEFSFSIGIGAVTKRLSGEVSELEWHP